MRKRVADLQWVAGEGGCEAETVYTANVFENDARQYYYICAAQNPELFCVALIDLDTDNDVILVSYEDDEGVMLAEAQRLAQQHHEDCLCGEVAL
jgi:hypothetical protein